MQTQTEFPPDSVVQAGSPEPAKRRVNAVDLLRGIVMVIMLLDHTREFVHAEALNFEPTNLTKTNTLLFFTRWITHFCAPVFVFLAGTGAFLQGVRGKSKSELSKFLVTRGLWLILLELTLIRVITWFNVDFHFAMQLQVIWVIGVGMIVLAGLIRLPLRVIAVISIAMIALHNTLDGIRIPPPAPGTAGPGFWGVVWMVLHQPGIVFFTPTIHGLVLYPLIPWIGVLWAGYCFGAVYQWESEQRRRFLLKLGGGMLMGFIVLRAINLYGDPLRWKVQKNAVFTVLSFLNVLKYPPSLLFLLMTLGVAILALPWFERMGQGWLPGVFTTFGRVPLLFYVGQWITAHALGISAGLLAGQPVGWQFAGFLERPSPNPGNLGFSLWVVYLCWLLGLLLLYPVCRWFAGIKRRRKDWWLSYL